MENIIQALALPPEATEADVVASILKLQSENSDLKTEVELNEGEIDSLKTTIANGPKSTSVNPFEIPQEAPESQLRNTLIEHEHIDKVWVSKDGKSWHFREVAGFKEKSREEILKGK